METGEPTIKSLPDLRSLKIEIPKTMTDGTHINTAEVVFNTIPLKVEIITLNDIRTTLSLGSLLIMIKISTKTEKDVASVSVNFRKINHEKVVADTGVTNTSRGLKGLGRTLWEMILPVIQKYADESNIRVHHRVIKKPDLGLGGKKWDELFNPILIANGYVEDEDSIWRREYEPRKK